MRRLNRRNKKAGPRKRPAFLDRIAQRPQWPSLENGLIFLYQDASASGAL